MYIVHVGGGLGNQFFHYAFGKALSIKNNCDVYYDIEAYKNFKVQNDPSSAKQHNLYCLKLYKTNVIQANPGDISKIKNMVTNVNRFPKIFNKIYHKSHQNISHFIFYKPPGIYNPSLLDYKGDFYFRGAFQSYKYFKDYRDEILKDFTLDIPLDVQNSKIMDQIKSTNSVSLHIRRGDYVKINALLPLAYYKNAIEYIMSKEKNLHFYIFSNDVDWVRVNLKIDAPSYAVDINPPNKGYYDLELMRHCKHNIIANSTFSWWGGWLNKNPEKIVISPKTYAGKNSEDRIPDSWVKL